MVTNAARLGLNLSAAHAVILSHGDFGHAGTGWPSPAAPWTGDPAAGRQTAPRGSSAYRVSARSAPNAVVVICCSFTVAGVRDDPGRDGRRSFTAACHTYGLISKPSTVR